jgi:hypothetical protein
MKAAMTAMKFAMDMSPFGSGPVRAIPGQAFDPTNDNDAGGNIVDPIEARRRLGPNPSMQELSNLMQGLARPVVLNAPTRR